MAVIVVLVDLEFCTKSECESVRFPRNFVTKYLLTQIQNWLSAKYLPISFDSDIFTNPTRFCLALIRLKLAQLQHFCLTYSKTRVTLDVPLVFTLPYSTRSVSIGVNHRGWWRASMVRELVDTKKLNIRIDYLYINWYYIFNPIPLGLMGRFPSGPPPYY